MAAPLDLKRTHIVKVRFNRSELDQFNSLAGDNPLASFARRSLLNQPLPPGKKRYNKQSGAQPASSPLVRQVAFIGNNLNQIARSLNTQLKNHPDQNFNTLLVAHMLQLVWKRLNDLQDI